MSLNGRVHRPRRPPLRRVGQKVRVPLGCGWHQDVRPLRNGGSVMCATTGNLHPPLWKVEINNDVPLMPAVKITGPCGKARVMSLQSAMTLQLELGAAIESWRAHHTEAALQQLWQPIQFPWREGKAP